MKRLSLKIICLKNPHSIKLYFLNLTELIGNTEILPHDYPSSDTEKRKGNKQAEQKYQEMFLLKMTKCINRVEPRCAVNPSNNKREVCK